MKSKIFVAIVLFAISSVFAGATNAVYIAQSAAGSGDGSSCGNAKAVTYFNTSGNWSASPSGVQIGPGTTVHLCGTITSALSFAGSGASGNPVILDGTGATMANEIDVLGRSWNTIQNVTWQSNQGGSFIVHLDGASNIVIQANTADNTNVNDTVWMDAANNGPCNNITIRNNYFRTTNADVGGKQEDIISTAGAGSVTVEGNYLSQRTVNFSPHNDVIQTFKGGCGNCTQNPQNWTIRYNRIILDVQDTGNRSWTMLENMAGTINIYSNVFEGQSTVDNGGNGLDVNTSAAGAIFNIIGNTFVQRGTGPPNVMSLQNTATWNLKNNIVYSTDAGQALGSASGANRVTNLWYGANIPSCSGTTDVCGQNPLFTNYSTKDYTLQAGSPAKATGTNLGAPYTFGIALTATWPGPELVTRPASGAWDKGAYQIGGGGSLPPNPPTGLTATPH